jgi:hypothetical protein
MSPISDSGITRYAGWHATDLTWAQRSLSAIRFSDASDVKASARIFVKVNGSTEDACHLVTSFVELHEVTASAMRTPSAQVR